MQESLEHRMPTQTISSLLDRLTTPRILALLFVIYLSFHTVLSPYFPPEGIKPLDLFFTYSPSEAYSIVEGYGEAGRAIYVKTELTLDIAFPVIYSLLLSTVLNFLVLSILPPQSAFRNLRYLPFAAAAIDILENLAIVALITLLPRHFDTLAALAGLLTSIKWILVALCMLTILISASIWLARHVSGKQAN